MKRIAADQLPVIKLTEQEQKIFSTLLAANKLFNLNTTFRVAGGWCRDKILGKNSDDIDIALNNLTGKQMEEYLLRMGPAYGVGKSYTVDANVEKSKHLQTVAIEIYGEKIDFVNLRSETYGDSRVPEMTFGKPDTDAARRDLTINSCFFNVNTGQVEDYVGGLEDLKTMTLRTPMDPKKTFTDDPLRVLRLLRFRARFPNSTIAPETLKALYDPEVHEAYKTKVSSERSGPELLKLLGGDAPSEALRILFETGLDKAVFNIPEMQGLDWRMDQKNKHHKHNVLEHTLQVVENLHNLLKEHNVSKDLQTKMLLSAALHDIGKLYPGIGQPKTKDPSQYSYIGHENKSVEIADKIMKSISIPEKDRKFVEKVIGLHMRPHNADWSPKQIGKFLRETEIQGQEKETADIWKYILLHAQADTMASNPDSPTYAQDIEKHKKAIQTIGDYQTSQNPLLKKPLLRGDELMVMFPTLKPNFTPPGQRTGFIKEITDKLMEAQDAGRVRDRTQAEKFIQSMRSYIEKKYSPQPPAAPQAPVTPIATAWVKKECKFASTGWIRSNCKFANQSPANQLPEIPNGMMRLVHITTANPSVFFSKGFDYSGQGIIQSTTRAFSSNQQLQEAGLFSKTDARFLAGYSILIDVPTEEVTIHSGRRAPGTIPSNFIYGAFSSKENKFIQNPNYNPTGSTLPENFKRSAPAKDRIPEVVPKGTPLDIPIPTSSTENTDIW